MHIKSSKRGVCHFDVADIDGESGREWKRLLGEPLL